MKKSTRRLTLLALPLALAAGPAHAIDLTYAALGGYQNGVGTRIQATAAQLLDGVPFGLSFGVGYSVRDPGDASLARHVFINDNENGTPEKSGYAWDLRLDGVWFFKVAPLEDFGVFVGARRSAFTGRFRYVGGNEDFLIEARDWGWGLGVRGGFRVSTRWSLALAAGFDHYPVSSLYGHDARYSSNASSVNPRTNAATGQDYSWRDADKAVNQPKYVPSLLIGLTYRP